MKFITKGTTIACGLTIALAFGAASDAFAGGDSSKHKDKGRHGGPDRIETHINNGAGAKAGADADSRSGVDFDADIMSKGGSGHGEAAAKASVSGVKGGTGTATIEGVQGGAGTASVEGVQGGSVSGVVGGQGQASSDTDVLTNVGFEGGSLENNIEGDSLMIEGDDYDNESIFIAQGRATIAAAIEGCLAMEGKQSGWNVALPGVGGLGRDDGYSDAVWVDACAQHAILMLEKQYEEAGKVEKESQAHQERMMLLKGAIRTYLDKGDATVFDTFLTKLELESPTFYVARRITERCASLHIAEFNEHNDRVRHPDKTDRQEFSDIAAHRGDTFCGVDEEAVRKQFHPGLEGLKIFKDPAP